jgi:hypothetical protein
LSSQDGPFELVSRVEAALAAGGLKPVVRDVGGPQVVVGATSAFRLQWMATRLHTLIYVSAFQPGSAADGVLDEYLAAACQDAIDQKGAWRGVQVGVSAIAVAAIDHATPQDEMWAARPHGRRFAAIAFPVVADPSTRRVIRPEKMVLGGIYAGYLQDLVRKYVERPLG